MFKLHIPWWQLLVYGAALYLIVLFRISGELLKHRLGRPPIGSRGKRSDMVAAASDV